MVAPSVDIAASISHISFRVSMGITGAGMGICEESGNHIGLGPGHVILIDIMFLCVLSKN